MRDSIMAVWTAGCRCLDGFLKFVWCSISALKLSYIKLTCAFSVAMLPAPPTAWLPSPRSYTTILASWKVSW